MLRLFGIKTLAFLALVMMAAAGSLSAQTPNPSPLPARSVGKYLDQKGGVTADEAVAIAIRTNPELEAMRREASAAESLIRQARLRPNPSLEVGGSKQLNGPDNSWMVEGGLPLELGGRRGARVRVAEREAEIRRLAVEERERQLAAEVRVKWGESLAAILKLMFTEEMLAAAMENYDLVAAQVEEGRRPPLERNMELVEVNRIRVIREVAEGQVEVRLFELRSLMAMTPEQGLRLRGSLERPIEPLSPIADAVQRALQSRPDLEGARAVERLAAARTEQARSEGRIDADLMLGYQDMRSGFPLSGFNDVGMLMPIDMRARAFTFGVKLAIPVRNRNQGMIAASIEEEAAARSRREFGELSIRRDVATAYARFNRSLRASEIYQVGVRDQASANLQVVRQTYEIGTKTLLDYIAELRRFIETENGYIDTQLEAYLGFVEVMRATNDPNLVKR